MDTSMERKSKDPFPGPAPIPEGKIKKFTRADAVSIDDLKSKRQEFKLKVWQRKNNFAVQQAARAERLLVEDSGGITTDGFGTSHITQREIADQVDIQSAQKHFDLRLNDFGPYRLRYTRNGRHLVLAGGRGHVAALDWQTKKLHCEINVMETTHDVAWLHQQTMFAVAQRQWTYIYDNQGIELHCLKAIDCALRLQFLPHHFLLASASSKGYLSYLDVSVGQKVAGYPTKMGRLDVMTYNPRNGISLLGHTGGTVTLWSPTVKEPLVKMLCHGSCVKSIAVDNSGNYLATSGVDRKLKIWDLRTYGTVSETRLGAGSSALSFSQRGSLATATGVFVHVYEGACTAAEPTLYLKHRLPSSVRDLQFCPFEDVLGVTHNTGFTSMIVPGSAEANFDALEANPYETKEQRKHKEVAMLLEKIPYDVISLEPDRVVKVDVKSAQEIIDERNKIKHMKPSELQFTPKYKKKGRSKTGRLEKRKKGVKGERRRDVVKQIVEMEEQEQMAERKEGKAASGKKTVGVGGALGRFKKKSTVSS